MCHCPHKGGAILSKVAFIAIIVTFAVSFHMWANTHHVRASTPEALDPALL